MAELIDIWMPVFNAAATLPLTLRSLLRQSHRDFRLIAVDDGSTDSSLELLAHAAAGDSRIEVRPQAHRGLVPALLACAEHSTAIFVARADADDLYHRERLAEQLARAHGADRPGLIGTRVTQFPGHLRGAGMRAYTRWVNGLTTHEQIARDRLIECPIVHSSFFFRRDAYDAAGGYRSDDSPEDFDLILRLIESGIRLASVPRLRTFWRLDAASLQRTDTRYRTEAFLEVKLAHLLRLQLLEQRAVVIWGQTAAGKWAARKLLDRGVEVTCFVERDPRKIGQHPYGIPVADDDSYSPDRGCFHLGMVRDQAARERIRDRLTAVGLSEWHHFAIMQ